MKTQLLLYVLENGPTCPACFTEISLLKVIGDIGIFDQLALDEVVLLFVGHILCVWGIKTGLAEPLGDVESNPAGTTCIDHMPELRRWMEEGVKLAQIKYSSNMDLREWHLAQCPGVTGRLRS
jgi:hypothetical protein